MDLELDQSTEIENNKNIILDPPLSIWTTTELALRQAASLYSLIIIVPTMH